MDEEALRRGQRLVVAEKPDLVADGRTAQPGNPDPGVNRIGKGDLGGVATTGLDHEPDLIAARRVEHALFDQPAVHGGVEERVVDDIVHVPIDVVVHPARGDDAECPVRGSVGWLLTLWHGPDVEERGAGKQDPTTRDA